MIAAGDSVRAKASGRDWTIQRVLGEGSQGVVFEAADSKGDCVAVKWYYPHTATDQQRQAIALLIERGAPHSRFLWPSDLVFASTAAGFGYVMPLRPREFASLSDLLIGRVDIPFRSVCCLCLELAHSFLQLHAQGLCYRDISFTNIFFDPRDGSPLICDNDNVGVDGMSPAAVMGTRRFMAPEIVRHEAVPSIQTDLYSLAVLLFYVLMMGHPLMGRRELDFDCWDELAESVLFGKDAHFIFDPNDDKNRPVPELHASVIRYWSIYPEFLRTQFTQAFTRGLVDPQHGRVRESVWRVALNRLHDSITECRSCRKQNFADTAAPARCWSCGVVIPPVAHCTVDTAEIAFGLGARITAHHVRRDYDIRTIVGVVEEHPTRPDVLGLRNESQDTWEATFANGDQRLIMPGRSVRVDPGLTLDLGPVVARIR